MRKNKYQYIRVLQGLYEGKWEDVLYFDMNDPEERKDSFVQIKCYRANENTAFRFVHRRVPADEQLHL